MTSIYFIYANEKGSSQMRCFQIREMLSNRFNCKLLYVLDERIHDITNSIVFFFKHIKIIKKVINLEKIKNNNNILIFDTIDLTHRPDIYSDFENDFYHYFDFIITPLVNLYNKNKHLPKTKYIPHHYDRALNNININPVKINKILYNGSKFYIEKYSNIIGDIHICNSFSLFIKNMDYYSSFKYNISFYDNDLIDSKYKPITKVATASAIGAVVICENSEENKRWLGNDYPFYIDLQNKEKSIVEWIRMINENRVDEKWIEIANNRMAYVRKELSLQNLIDCYYIPFFKKIMKRFEKISNNGDNRNVVRKHVEIESTDINSLKKLLKKKEKCNSKEEKRKIKMKINEMMNKKK